MTTRRGNDAQAVNDLIEWVTKARYDQTPDVPGDIDVATRQATAGEVMKILRGHGIPIDMEYAGKIISAPGKTLPDSRVVPYSPLDLSCDLYYGMGT